MITSTIRFGRNRVAARVRAAQRPACKSNPKWSLAGRYVRIATLGTSYASGTGTSYSAPHVAGTAALMLETNPALTPDSLKKIILLTAVDMGPAGNDNSYGYGLVMPTARSSWRPPVEWGGSPDM